MAYKEQFDKFTFVKIYKKNCKIEYQMIYYWHNKKQDGDRTLQ